MNIIVDLGMLRKSLVTTIALGVLLFNTAQSQENQGKDFLKYVDPRIGSEAVLLEPTRPTVQLPNQMIRMFPIRSGYIDQEISSFPLNVVSHRLGEVFAVKPHVGPLKPNSWKDKLTYDHDLEVNRPWYYSTYLINEEIKVEFTAGKKTGMYRFTFPKNAESRSLLFSLYNDPSGTYKLIDGNIIEGLEIYHGDIKIYLFGILSQKGTSESTGGQAKITFDKDGSPSVELRYAISYISPEQAKKNFMKEFDGKSFEDLEREGEQAWDKTINNMQVEGGTEAQRRSFYTAYYRCFERMIDINEDGKYYSGFDKKVHETKGPFYVDDWTWDTYLAHHPLRTIVNPKMEEQMLDSYVKMYEQSGWMPTFPVLFGDHICMNGFHSSIMFLDGYRKGLRNFNVSKAYEGMLKNATQATMLPWKNGPKTSLDDFYYANGYFPALAKDEKESVQEVHSFEKRQSVAVTLGASYDDWALGEMAKELGKKEDQALFAGRALNYKNLWDDKSQLFMPKDKSGAWVKIDPKFDGGMGGRDYYDENNGYTFQWQVQHDIPGLISLMGGKKSFENNLDQLFRESLGRSKYSFWAKFPDATGLVGQYSMGNEPSFHIPYLYNFTSPWKTQQRIRFLLDVWFKDNIFGIPGDEDGGGMSAFVVFSSMGFYPITPGIPVYTIGSPVFSKVTIDLEGGKKFTVIANNCSVVNKYIQSAKFNGKPLDTPWFSHQDLMNGGTLELEMGPLPNKSWGLN